MKPDPPSRLHLAVVLDMGLCRVLGVLDGMHSVSLRNLGMVTGFLVSAGFVVLGRFHMVTSSLLVMLSGFFVVVCGLF